MKITAVVWDGCPNGVDCDRVYDTDGEDVVVRGRYLTADEAAELGLDLPAHEGLLLIPRQAMRGQR